MRLRQYALFAVSIGLFAALFTYSSALLRKEKRVDASPEIAVALPLFIQVLMSGGDRFLAANLGSVRGIIAETSKMRPEEYTLLARLQVDVSWLNPAHEDNYYTASALLPWNGQLDAAQTVLRRASLARPFDYLPPFYYAFNLVFFKNDPLEAAEWLRARARELPNADKRLMLESFAARWLDRASNLGLAIAVIESMAKQAKRKDFREYLQTRAQRLRTLLSLRDAASAFLKKKGVPARSLEELVEEGFIRGIPSDPFGAGFRMDSDGTPIFDGARVDVYGNKY
ncbi:MAG: hypothetical protein LBD67_07005 [Candidatus Accumulibacter sp.]|jgi:hypothetical protein|nr:hypothetical protein [Accumulibacter sp.]